MTTQLRWFKGDKWTDQLGSQIPLGSCVKVITFLFRRRVLVDYQGKWFLTMLWCLSKTPPSADQLYLIVERRKREFQRIYTAITI